MNPLPVILLVRTASASAIVICDTFTLILPLRSTILRVNMSSMDFLWIADRNARAVSLLERGAHKEARTEWMGALQDLVQRRKRHDLDDDLRFEDGSYRCFNDAPLKSPYDNDTYSVFISENKNASSTDSCHPIYSSAFVLGGDIPIVMEAVCGVVMMNLALWYHHEGLAIGGRRHKKSQFAFRKAKMLYTQAYRCIRGLFQDQPMLKKSVALRVLFAAICYNLSNLHWFVYCDTTGALSFMQQFHSMVLLIASSENEQLPACDVQFFHRSRLFYADFAVDHSPFMFSPAA